LSGKVFEPKKRYAGGPMSREYDKPIFIEVKSVDSKDKDIVNQYMEDIKNLCDNQAFAVLSTHGLDETGAFLIAFATSSDLKYIVFLTPKNTTKYDHILENNNIAILIDNRSDHPEGINQISAFTLSGSASIMSGGQDDDKWTDLFLKKHPNLFEFANSPSTVKVIVEVRKFIYVSKFQEVFEMEVFHDL
jgi:hypothetical protein